MNSYEKTVLITGGSSGYGKAMAKLFTQEGYRVIIAARTEKNLQEAAAEIGCDYLVMDVTRSCDWQKAVETEKSRNVPSRDRAGQAWR